MGLKFQCTKCDHHSTQKGALVTHQRSVHMGRNFPCPECDIQFTREANLVTHHKSVHIVQSVIIRQLKKETKLDIKKKCT